MFQAQLLIASGTSSKVFSPWMARRGDNLRATAELVDVSGTGATLTVRVFTKKADESGDGTDANASTTISLTAAGRSDAEWSGNELLDMVRYQFEVGDSTGDWVLFRMLSPVWFDSVAG